MNESALIRQRYLIEREIFRRKARSKLLSFILWNRADYSVNWHHRLLCKYLDKVVSGEIKRLIVSMPPRHGKSEIISRNFPAYWLGLFPDSEIISASYAQTLASSMNRDVQRVIDSPAYRDVFPGTTLAGEAADRASGTWLRNNDEFEIVGHRGKYVCSGVGGGLTGKGADLLLIDDPHKNYEEAMSATVREKIIEWYDAVASTRLSKDAPVIIVQTRWHQADLAGTLLERARQNPNADQWVELRLPGIKDEDDPVDPRAIGEALWPQRFPVERLEKIRAANPSIHTALYQGRPTAKEGEGFKRHWFKYFQVRPDNLDEEILSIDCTFKDSSGSDFVVIQHWGRKAAFRYRLQEWRGRWDFPATIRQILSAKEACPKVFRILVEDKANGPAVIATLKGKITGLTPYDPKTSKEARAAAVSPQVEGGNVFIPDPNYYPESKEWLDEVCGFPNAAHDDRVDAMSQALLYFENGGGSYLEKLLSM